MCFISIIQVKYPRGWPETAKDPGSLTMSWLLASRVRGYTLCGNPYVYMKVHAFGLRSARIDQLSKFKLLD